MKINESHVSTSKVSFLNLDSRIRAMSTGIDVPHRQSYNQKSRIRKKKWRWKKGQCYCVIAKFYSAVMEDNRK